MAATLPANDPFVTEYQPSEFSINRVGGFLMDEIPLIDDELTLLYRFSSSCTARSPNVEVQPTVVSSGQLPIVRSPGRLSRVPGLSSSFHCRSNRSVHKLQSGSPVPSYLQYRWQFRR